MIYGLRCCLCEIFIGWALKIAPDDYMPSCVQVVVDLKQQLEGCGG